MIDFDFLAHEGQRSAFVKPGFAVGVVEQCGVRHDLLLRAVNIDVWMAAV
jgi:hypothetical protein